MKEDKAFHPDWCTEDLSKLQLAKEVEEDTAGSLRSVLGEEELTQNDH